MAHHEPFKALGPIDWASLDDKLDSSISDLLAATLPDAQTIIDSIPDATSTGPARSSGRARSHTDSAVDSRPSLDVSSRAAAVAAAQLRKDWREVKLNPRDNPLAISVYKLAAKDGKGAWFARRSIHEGLPFEKWRLGMEHEFAETLKVNGAQQAVEPGAGNVRGIGAERRVVRKVVDGKGKAEVFQLSVQFPGPTTPRDFVALLLSTDISPVSQGKNDQRPAPRQFMLVSKPCAHPDCPPRQGFIRGTYESVEMIREVPVEKPLRRTRSSIDITRDEAKAMAGTPGSITREAMLRSARKAGSDTEGGLGSAVSFAADLTSEAGNEEEPEMAVEWLMVTRSDPGGSVPRFMVEKGTPGGIVSDAGRFVKWVTAKRMEDFTPDNGNDCREEALTIEGESTDQNGVTRTPAPTQNLQADPQTRAEAADGAVPPGGFYSMLAGALGAAGSAVVNRMPTFNTSTRENSEEDELGDESDASSQASFASAEEGEDTAPSLPEPSIKDTEPAPSMRSTVSDESQAMSGLSATPTQHEKDLKKLQERRRKIQEKIIKMGERAAAKKRDDNEKDSAALAKLREKHERELARQEEKYQRDLKKLEQKRQQEERKAEERRRKQTEREERSNMQLELERAKAERDVARKEIDVLKDQVGELQSQNTLLVAKLGKVGALGRSDSWNSLAKSKTALDKPLVDGLPS